MNTSSSSTLPIDPRSGAAAQGGLPVEDDTSPSTPAGNAQAGTGAQTPTTLSGNAALASEDASINQSGKPHSDESRFDIPEFVRLKYPDLIPLVLETESMNDEERQYWFHILPIMTPEQVNKFRAILVNEKEQLAKLDHTYENELKNLNSKNSNVANIYKTKEKQKEIRKKEALDEVEEKAKEEDILKQLGSL